MLWLVAVVGGAGEYQPNLQAEGQPRLLAPIELHAVERRILLAVRPVDNPAPTETEPRERVVNIPKGQLGLLRSICVHDPNVPIKRRPNREHDLAPIRAEPRIVLSAKARLTIKGEPDVGAAVGVHRVYLSIATFICSDIHDPCTVPAEGRREAEAVYQARQVAAVTVHAVDRSGFTAIGDEQNLPSIRAQDRGLVVI